MIIKMKQFIKNYLFILKIAAFTAAAVIIFEVINLFVLYGYIKTDLYVSLAAISFLTAGLLINRKQKRGEAQTLTVTTAPELLTRREKQIMQLIAEGKTNKEIAAAYFIEVSTVKTHVNNIYCKLAVKNRKEACVKYAQMEANQ